MARMGDIDDHSHLLHVADDGPAKFGQPALCLAVHRSGQLIVEKMHQPRHPHAGIIKLLQIGPLAFQRLQAFRREQHADRAAVPGAEFRQAVDIRRIADHRQPARRILHRPLQFLRVIELPLEQREPGSHRLQLGNRQQGDIVGVGAVAVVILAPRRLGHAGKYLQPDIAVLHALEVDMAIVDAVGDLALPQQRVAMQIDDHQTVVQPLRVGADFRQRLAVDHIGLLLEPCRSEDQKGDDSNRDETDQCQRDFLHGAFRFIVTKL